MRTTWQDTRDAMASIFIGLPREVTPIVWEFHDPYPNFLMIHTTNTEIFIETRRKASDREWIWD